METSEFAARIRAHYPEGLTGIFAIGATRRTYILERHRQHSDDPGRIDDFSEMGAFLLDRYLKFCADFFALGGQNMVITALSYRSFFERGPEYARQVIPEAMRMISPHTLDFYRAHDIDPYFIGLEVLLRQPSDSPVHQMAVEFQQFMASWPYQEGRRKLLWEIASIPMLSFWQVSQRMTPAERQALDDQLNQTHDLNATQQLLYTYFSKAVLGTSLPMPHFYLGTNMGGDLKFRAPLLLSLTGGEYLRAYYTPYPTLFLTPQSFQVILEDLAFGERLHAPKAVDYAGRYTAELVDAEYQRIQVLVENPGNVLGMTRKVEATT